MRYVVTGSPGFIGRHVCAELLEHVHAVVGIDAFTDYYDPALKRANADWLTGQPAFHGVEMDLVTGELEDLVAGAGAVIHLAGQPGVRLSWAEYFHVYVERNITAS